MTQWNQICNLIVNSTFLVMDAARLCCSPLINQSQTIFVENQVCNFYQIVSNNFLYSLAE